MWRIFITAFCLCSLVRTFVLDVHLVGVVHGEDPLVGGAVAHVEVLQKQVEFFKKERYFSKTYFYYVPASPARRTELEPGLTRGRRRRKAPSSGRRARLLTDGKITSEKLVLGTEEVSTMTTEGEGHQ